MSTGYDPDQNSSWSKANLDAELFAIDADEIDEEWILLNAYLDGEADAQESERACRLLSERPGLAEDLGFARLVGGATRDYVEIEPPSELRAAIFAATTLRPTCASRLAAAWDRVRATFGSARYAALPVGALAAAALACILILPRNGSHAAKIAAPAPAQVAVNSVPSVVPSAPAPLAPPAVSHTAPVIAEVPAAPAPQRRQVERVARPMIVAKATPEVGRPHISRAERREQPNRTRVQLANIPSAVRDEKQAEQMVPEAPRQSDEAAYHVHPGWHHASVSTMDEDRTVVAASDAGSATKVVYASASAPTRAAQPAVTVHYGHVLRDQLAPDPHMIVTGADLKREANAQTLGYDRDAMENIRKHEATVSLVSGKF
jgi:hypothetical protein